MPGDTSCAFLRPILPTYQHLTFATTPHKHAHSARPARNYYRYTLSLEPVRSQAEHLNFTAESSLQLLDLADTWVAVNKPAGMLVHKTKLYHALPNETYLVDHVSRLVESNLGEKVRVLPVQRLDRPTSGVILFALGDSTNAARLQAALQSEFSKKQYWALSFGADMPEKWENNHPLRDLRGKHRKQRSATTVFEQLHRFDHADISVVKACISTGRRHQIRRHLSNSRYPILGDTTHGKGVQNRKARELFGVTRCCLHARSVSFRDPLTSLDVVIDVPVPEDLQNVQARIKEYDNDLRDGDARRVD